MSLDEPRPQPDRIPNRATGSVVARGERKSIAVGSIWMVVISLALFFVPLINGLAGGLVGGYLVGSPKRALGAAVLPSIVVGVVTWIILAVLDLPVAGFFAGLAVIVLVLFADLGLFIGAAVGGYLARSGRKAAITGR